jgi:hypothetical protein
MADRREGAFDDVRCAQMLPVLGRKVSPQASIGPQGSIDGLSLMRPALDSIAFVPE